MNYRDNDIHTLYKLEFERTLRGADIYCDIIDNNKTICFIHCQREVLHAIELCFKDENIPTKFKEADWCKGLLININHIPAIPPFKHLKKYYVKCFLDRLTLIEQWFTGNSISHSDLILKKNKLLKQKIILYKHTQSIRNLYEAKRNSIMFQRTPVQ